MQMLFSFMFLLLAVFTADNSCFDSTLYLSKIKDTTNEKTMEILTKFNEDVFLKIDTMYNFENNMLNSFESLLVKAKENVKQHKNDINSDNENEQNDIQNFYIKFVETVISQYFRNTIITQHLFFEQVLNEKLNVFKAKPKTMQEFLADYVVLLLEFENLIMKVKLQQSSQDNYQIHTLKPCETTNYNQIGDREHIDTLPKRKHGATNPSIYNSTNCSVKSSEIKVGDVSMSLKFEGKIGDSAMSEYANIINGLFSQLKEGPGSSRKHKNSSARNYNNERNPLVVVTNENDASKECNDVAGASCTTEDADKDPKCVTASIKCDDVAGEKFRVRDAPLNLQDDSTKSNDVAGASCEAEDNAYSKLESKKDTEKQKPGRNSNLEKIINAIVALD